MERTQILQAVGKAYRDFKRAFSPDKTTDELFTAFSNSLKQSLGDYETVYDYIWGKDSLNIDGITHDYIPQTGDTLIMDISVGVDGVWCDVCRTFFVGAISDEQERVYRTVLRSLRAGHKALRADVRACDVYAAANAVYAAEGKTLVHHAGHRIGDQPLLQPQFLADNDTPLVCGETYTVETGLYDGFGIRLENNYLVTKQGAEDLFEEILPPENIKEYILL